MTSPSRDQLLGYLLGALERAEQERIDAELDQNDALRAEMRRLQVCVSRLGLDSHPQQFDPPPGLAQKTCELVAARAESSAVTPASRTTERAVEPQRRFTWSDLLVAAAALIVAAALFFPSLEYSRFNAQVAVCQNQLRFIGAGLQEFSDRQPDHGFPGPEPSGPRAAAGVIAPVLVSHQLVTDSRVFLCPSSPAKRLAGKFHVPLLDELDQLSGPDLAAAQRLMGGDYGYNMGYVSDGKLLRACNFRRDQYILVADAPSDYQPGRVSANHRGRGQNVLYEDGHVQFLPQLPSPKLLDDPYHNREGWVAAGLDRDDAVLGASADRPMPIVPISQ
jgi:hypothetical protein